MKWSYRNFKAVCRQRLTHATIDQIQAERAESSLLPLALEEIVNACVCFPQSHHFDRAKFLLSMKKGSAA